MSFSQTRVIARPKSPRPVHVTPSALVPRVPILVFVLTWFFDKLRSLIMWPGLSGEPSVNPMYLEAYEALWRADIWYEPSRMNHS